MPSPWKSIPPPPLFFSSSFEHRPVWGNYTVPPQIRARQQMVLINWHWLRSAIEGEGQEKLDEDVFLSSVCQALAALFPHLKSPSYLWKPWENTSNAQEGGKRWKGGESCSFSTSASNQSPEITVVVYGLWSWLLFHTVRERVARGKGRGNRGSGEQGES